MEPHLRQALRPRRHSPECPWGCPVELHGWPRTGPSRSGDGGDSPRLRDQPFGNGPLPAGAEPLGGRAPETAGSANLPSVHLPSLSMPSAGVIFPGDVDGTGPQVPCRLAIPALLGSVHLSPRSAGRVRNSHKASTGWTRSIRTAAPGKNKEGNPVTVLSGLSGALTGPEAGP